MGGFQILLVPICCDPTNTFSPPKHLEVLVALYFHPSTAAVPRLRQCLGLFFDVMSSQRYEDQQLIQKVVVRSYKFLVETYKEHKRDMVAPLLISKQLSSWTDIRHLQLSVKSRDKCLHLLTAKELLDLAWKTPELAKDLCQMLGTFHIIGDVDDNDARELSILCDNVTQLVFDSPTKNSIKKFKALFKYEEVEEAEPESGEQSEGS
ncbi:hypothetical protein HK102_010966 [Quaeritorhiza haematococci]|nr:hypothetical protein HK102_010966 [Quaeritorhiza haematococci]